MTPPERRVLVYAPNWLGDLVMTTPLLSWLHAWSRGGAGARLILVLGVRRRWASLFQDDPRLDDLLVFERQGRHAGTRGLFHQAALVKSGRFDGVILGPPSLRAGLVAWLARVPVRVGYRGEGRDLLLTHRLTRPERGRQHFVHEMLALGAALLRAWRLEGDVGLIPPAPVPELTPARRNDEISRPNREEPDYWVLAPGTTYGQAKTWPVQRVAQFLALAVEERRQQVVLLGDPSARAFTQRLKSRGNLAWRQHLAAIPGVVDLVGRTDLPGAVAMLQKARAFVGNDSGLMHVAAALGVPTVGIFGSSNPDWTAPLGRWTEAVVPEEFPCRPCYRKTCNQEIFCLDTLEPDQVLRSLDRVLGRRQSG